MSEDRPDEVFCYDVNGGQLTWRQLHEEGLRWARRFAELGVDPGATVATLVAKNVRNYALWLGLSWRRSVEVGINPDDRGEALIRAINQSGARLLLIEERCLPTLESVADDLRQITDLIVLDDDSASTGRPAAGACMQDLTEERESGAILDPQWHDISCVAFTSGTTGAPKPILVPWGQFHAMNLGIYPYEDLGPQDVLYDFSPAYRGGKGAVYLAAMIRGKAVVREGFDLSQFWIDVERYGVTTIAVVGPIAEALMRSDAGPGPATTLRNVFMAPLIRDYHEFAKRFGVRICTIYNSMEMSVPIRSGDWSPRDWRTSGRPREGYPGYEIRIVDKNDYEVAPGKVGELIVRTDVPWTLNAGYLNMPAATASAWRNGWFHTGDAMMRRADGEYVLVDRMKDTIERQGATISSLEIEAEVLVHPDVNECAAIAVPGEDQDEIFLYVVLRKGSHLTPERLIRDLISSLEQSRIPRYVEFVDNLPRTPVTHRVQKADLRKRGIGAGAWDRMATEVDEVDG